MKQVLSEIQDGTFASEFMQEFSSGRKARTHRAQNRTCRAGTRTAPG